jgi:RNA polymerase sigma factor (sigma-70 family)
MLMPTAQLEPLVARLRTAAALGCTATQDDGQLLARFAADRDEAAFTALVKRHGPLVLAACRRLLRDWHAAQDAFQATFLVLARKAEAVAQPELLSRWLHGVACRTALRARADAARRWERERRAAPAGAVAPDEGLVWRELRPVLDEEIARLPRRQGAAVVLCYLEGRTNAEAARRLGCSRGTVATLLARARARLRRRLAGRGLSVPAALVATALLGSARGAGVPVTLTDSTVKVAAAFAAGGTGAAGSVSARAASLAEGVTQTMMVKKLKVIAATLLLAGLVAGGAGVLAYRASAQGPPAAVAEAPAPVAAPVAKPRAPEGAVAYRTDNFVVTAPSQAIAEKVGWAAERHRRSQASLWLEKKLPQWPEPCPIQVTITERESAHVTVFQFAEGRLTGMRMELRGPLERILQDQLPHEVTHTVLASWFRRPISRWADEGAAVLAENAGRNRSERLLRGLLKEGRFIPLRKLLPLREYPKDVAAMYPQAASLVAFLADAGSHKQILNFLAAGEQGSWDKAVQAHYDYESVAELETAWLDHVRRRLASAAPVASQPAAPPVMQQIPYLDRLFDNRPEPKRPESTRTRPRGRLPVGPAPVQALVQLSADGQFLRVWRDVAAYLPVTTSRANGQKVTSYVLVPTTFEQVYPLKAARVLNTRGKRLETQQIQKALKGETVVLLAFGDRPVDPLHLRLLKDDTLLIVLPQDPTPAVVPPAPTFAVPQPVPAAPAVSPPAPTLPAPPVVPEEPAAAPPPPRVP